MAATPSWGGAWWCAQVAVVAVLLTNAIAAEAQLTLLEPGYAVRSLPQSQGAKAAECSPGGVWGDYLYVSESNAGEIVRIDALDDVSVFASGLGFPVGMAFGPGPSATFGTFLYVADFDGEIHRIDSSGAVSLFVVHTLTGDLAFDPTGAYGSDLFVTQAFTGPVQTLDPVGVSSAFSSSASTYLRFAPGGPWGSGLYATRNDAQRELVTIDAGGSVTSFATGFVQPEGFDWAPGPGFGGDLFATDVDGDIVYRVDALGAKSAFATVDAPADVSYCNGQLYVVTLNGECFAINEDLSAVPALGDVLRASLVAMLLVLGALGLYCRTARNRMAWGTCVAMGLAIGEVQIAAAHDDDDTDTRTELFAVLDGAQVVPPVATTADGGAFFLLDEATGEVEWSIVYQGLASSVQSIKIHGPAGVGAVGPAQINAGWPGGPHTPVNGTQSLDAVEMAQLLAGDWYVSVVTTGQPAGEIRGQIVEKTATGTAGPNHAEHGFSLSPRGTIRVLLIFAELDPACPGMLEDHAGWLQGTIPQPADDWLDATAPIAEPQKYITDYYYQASFGEYLVLGEYVTTIVKVPCASINTSKPHLPVPALNALLAQYPGGTFPLSHSTDLVSAGFDQWTRMPGGIEKLELPNGKLDAVAIIWRNAGTNCNAGYAFQGFGTPAIGPFTGIDVLGSFTACGGSTPASWDLFIAEYFHALYGNNNFHTASGAGSQTLMEFPSASFSTTAQSGSTGNAVNAWDRNQLDWKPAGKTNPFEAMGAGCGVGVPSDLDIATHPSGGTFCLRDGQLTGDAIRIKLPHIDHDPGGGQPVKNQYLILENRRLDSSATPYVHNHDRIGQIAFNPFVACRELSQPGMYAYLQIGKDAKWGTYSELYAAGPLGNANALGSWFFPLPADGRFDTHYDLSKQQAAVPGLCGNFNNANVPEDEIHPFTVPNPFTGQSDLGTRLDLDGDGSLNSGFAPPTGLSRVLRSGSVFHTLHSFGDSGDAFNTASGRTVLRISSNPAPLPVYTWSRFGGEQGSDANKLHAARRPDDNDRVYLNGLAIQIIAEHPNGNIEVSISWDDYVIDRTVRWAGDIVLQPDPDDPLLRNPLLDIAIRIDLERGRSPTQLDSFEVLPSGEHAFTPPTLLTLESGTLSLVESDGGIVVDEGSTLLVKSGATLAALGSGFISIESGAYICAVPGSVQLASPESELYLHPGSNIGIHPALGLGPSPCAQLQNFDLGPGTVRNAGLCSAPPSSLAAWWPLDEQSFPAIEVAYGNDAITHGGVTHTPGRAQDGVLLDGLSQWLESPDAGPLRLTRSFTLATWVRTNDPASDRILIEKRTPGRGFTLALDQGIPSLELCSQIGPFGNCDSTASGSAINDGLWHHVAVTVDITPGITFWYVDGRAVSTDSFPSGINASLLETETSPLTIGGGSSGGHFKGILDEVQMYTAVLSPDDIRELYRSGSAGSCRFFAAAPWDRSFCQGVSHVTIPMRLCNPSSSSQTFDISADGISASSSPDCDTDGPQASDISFPFGSQRTLSPGACGTVIIGFDRPSGLDQQGEVACYEVTTTSQSTGRSFVSRGSLVQNDQLCITANPPADIGVGVSLPLDFSVQNTSGAMQTYSVAVVAMCEDQDPAQVSSLDFALNGQPAGQSVTMEFTLDAGETGIVQIQVQALRHRLGACDIILAPSDDPAGLAAAFASQQIVTVYPGPACSDGILDPGEECDDLNSISGDGCWSNCEVEHEFEIFGTAQGGSVELDVDGVVLIVPTTPGMSAPSIVAAMVAAINADATLQGLGVGALGQAKVLVTNGTLSVVLMDPGLVPNLGAMPLLVSALMSLGLCIHGATVLVRRDSQTHGRT